MGKMMQNPVPFKGGLLEILHVGKWVNLSLPFHFMELFFVNHFFVTGLAVKQVKARDRDADLVS